MLWIVVARRLQFTWQHHNLEACAIPYCCARSTFGPVGLRALHLLMNNCIYKTKTVVHMAEGLRLILILYTFLCSNLSSNTFFIFLTITISQVCKFHLLVTTIYSSVQNVLINIKHWCLVVAPWDRNVVDIILF